ncbi:hypothetical protein GGR40_003241 [Novosphingobium gossypii]
MEAAERRSERDVCFTSRIYVQAVELPLQKVINFRSCNKDKG